jgi:hypothetical protein
MRYLFIVVYLTIISCSGIKGKIEKRDKACDGVLNSKKVFVVNKSKTEKYKFTIKTIETIDDTIKRYSTDQIILEAGDEEDLGCDFYYSAQEYLSIEKIQVVGLEKDTIYEYGNKFYSKSEINKLVEKAKAPSFDEYIAYFKIKKIPQFYPYEKRKTEKENMIFKDGDIRAVDKPDVKAAISLGVETVSLFDTLINNIPLKYYKYNIIDSTKLLSQKKHSLKYEVTGQVVVKEKVK